ncbi:NAD-P-binding protein [Trametopsis cervina]|nr:NAD-P-binding protein [Trametopsis cervina]
MPAVNSGKVLVTGANGFIAAWVVKTLLDEGYAVRGTARSESKGAHLKEIFKEYGDKFEFVVVEDITREGAFDDAVKGVDAIEHTASPFHFAVDDPAELITPAVAGTGSVLQSAFKHGTQVKRVVVTSSVAAVLEILPDPPVFTEEHWNGQAVKNVEEKGKDASPADKYRASKTLAEKAAWAFVQNNKAKITFDLVVVNPPMVMGPVLHEVTDPEKLNTSMLDWYKTVIKGARTNEELFTVSSSWVDVRDLAVAHVLAIQKEEAAENRFIISAGAYVWQEWVNVAHAQDSNLVAGDPNADLSKVFYPMRYDTSKADRVLGIKYRTMKETTKDILGQFREKGWIQ